MSDLFLDATKRALAEESRAIERALAGWIAQSGLTAEEWGKVYGYRVERRWEGLTMHSRIIPVLLSEPQYVFPQPAPALVDW